eukprot:m.184696 g.184696  ORF g.184696 m.184696 type:complete len:78 (-) comp53527_c0_seq11:214-447(-)
MNRAILHFHHSFISGFAGTSRLDHTHPVFQPLGLELSLPRTFGNLSPPDQEDLSSECGQEASEALFHPEEYADAAFV